MFSKVLFLSVLGFLLLLSPNLVQGDEGMWLPVQIPELPFETLKARGLKLSPDEVYSETGVSLRDACVRLNGAGSYGSASFVSKEGLIVTNHHVAFGAIQSSSTTEENFIRQGFLAKTREEEKSCPDYEVYITHLQKEVTAEVLSAVKEGMTDAERTRAINRKAGEISRAHRSGDSRRAQVLEMLSGSRYFLIVYDVIQDLRLVYAPPRSIGEYGGETDNWMWPRHTGDFSFMRAYVAPDGKFVKYAKENVPYVPKKVLPIAKKGVSEGDLVFILGYPGTTLRYRDSNSVAYRQDQLIPFEIEMTRAEIEILEDAGKNDEELKLRFADRVKGLYNELKKNEGMLLGLKRTGLVEKKVETEAAFREFLKEKPELAKECVPAMDKMVEIYADLKTYSEVQSVLGQFFSSSDILAFAGVMHQIEEQLAKPDADREDAFKEENLGKLKETVGEMGKDLHPPTDSRILKVIMKRSLRLPGGSGSPRWTRS